MMNSGKNTFHALLVGALIGASAFALFSLVLPKEYTSKGKLLFHRNPVEIPALVFEESKNRWAWVRDGFALQSLAMSDTAIKQCEKSSKVVATFGSGDDYTLSIEVKARSAEESLSCISRVIEFIKQYAENFRTDQLKKAELNLKTTKFKDEAAASFKIEESFAPYRTVVVKAPEKPEKQSWPNTSLLTAIGFFLGGVLSWLLSLYKRSA